MNLYHQFCATVDRAPQNIAIRVGAEESTFADVHTRIHVVARHLGNQRGDHIALLGSNHAAFVSGVFGIFAADGVVVPLNAMLTTTELLPQILHADITQLLYTASMRELVETLQAAGLTIPTACIEDIETTDNETGDDLSAVASDADRLAMILFTSGTTADPKGVMLTHHNLLANHESFAAHFGFSAADCMLIVLPLFHSFAFTVQLLPMAILGCRLILHDGFKPKDLMADFRRETNIVFAGVPPMYALLAGAFPTTDDAEDLAPRIRYLVSGGGPMPRAVYDMFVTRTGLDIVEGYGLTEAAPVVSCNLPGSVNRPGTVGCALAGIKVAVWNAAGEPLPANEEGELVVQGANVMRGYYNNSASTAQALRAEGWLKTGDLAVMDAAGYIRIAGRAKELIVMAGENIHPREIEEVLSQHPTVFEAAVIGVPDRLKTEVPKAFIAPAPGERLTTISPDTVRAFLTGKLAKHKVPVYWEVVATLPKTPTGKIDKKRLAADALH